MSIEKKLEQYTLKNPQEVLLITVEINNQEEEIIIFKGFSSSLTKPTAFDPDIPVLPSEAKIITIDRIKSPFIPDNIQYIEQGLTWEDFQQRLSKI
jgi:hypothetical protein